MPIFQTPATEGICAEGFSSEDILLMTATFASASPSPRRNSTLGAAGGSPGKSPEITQPAASMRLQEAINAHQGGHIRVRGSSTQSEGFCLHKTPRGNMAIVAAGAGLPAAAPGSHISGAHAEGDQNEAVAMPWSNNRAACGLFSPSYSLLQ